MTYILQLIPPYEPLKFPLSDEQFDELLRAMPNDHHAESKRFDNCYLATKYARHSHSTPAHVQAQTKAPGQTQSKRKTRSSHSLSMNLDNHRRRKDGGTKSMTAISSNDTMMINANGDAILRFYDEDDDGSDFFKHHLAAKDDLVRYKHNVANCDDNDEFEDDGYGDIGDDDDDDDDDYNDDFYYDRGFQEHYTSRQKRRQHNNGRYPGRESDGDSSDTEPFEDEDPNDPEWRGEPGEVRQRKKV